MVYTGAIKNMFGAVPGEQKIEYHLKMSEYNEFANALIDIYIAAKPTLSIMDAIIGMDKEGPTAGRPKKIGLIIASSDGFSLDIAALKIVNINPNNVPVLRNALIRKLCTLNIEIIGDVDENFKILNFESNYKLNYKLPLL